MEPEPAGDGDAASRLTELGRAATVAIGVPSADGGLALWGSGVLVAPGWVVTCAHVFRPAMDGTRVSRRLGGEAQFLVDVDGRLHTGQVAYLAQESSRDGRLMDFALVALSAEPQEGSGPRGADPQDAGRARDAEPPCGGPVSAYSLWRRVAWCGDRSPALSGRGRLHGHQPVRAPGGTGHFAVHTTCEISADENGDAVVGRATLLREGYSGGPLVDVERGEVVGLLAQQQEGRTGRVLPLERLYQLGSCHHVPGAPDLGEHPWRELLRRHDRWHVEYQDRADADFTWTDTRQRLPRTARALRPVDRLAELELLAALPDPESPRAVRHALKPERGRFDWPEWMTGWREGYAQLGWSRYEHQSYLWGVYHELNQAEQRANRDGPSEPVRRLHDWLALRRRELDPAERSSLGSRTERRWPSTVLVGIEPQETYERQARSYRWSISYGFGGGDWQVEEQGGGGVLGLPFVEAVGEVRDRLGETLVDADRGSLPARLELVLPDDELALAAHQWRSRGGAIGEQREVVVRHVPTRSRTTASLRDDMERLDAGGSLRGVELQDEAVLEGLGAGELPVLCGHAGGTGEHLVRAVLESGRSVALLRAGVHPHDTCPDGTCADFRRNAIAWLADARVNELPLKLMELREKAGRSPAPGQEWCSELVLLFDHPGNPVGASEAG